MARSALAMQTLPTLSVLLVEDNSSDAFVVSSMLEGDRNVYYETHHVRMQSAAIAALCERSFDVCLLDLTLPDTSGFSALISIQEKAPSMPILILTGMKDMNLAKRAVGRGAQDYLLKDELEGGGLIRSIDYAMERKRLEKNLFQRANCDALTGLANRDLFLNRLHMALARSERSGSGVAVLFIDLDRFKHINDTHGHDSGDEVLKATAERIRSALRAYDTPARFGGDEFAVLLEGIDTPRDAGLITQKILRELEAPIHYHEKTLKIEASIGIAYTSEHSNADMLLQYSDIAMYHAKKQGGGYRFYTQNMNEAATARLSMEEDLRTALTAGELCLYYQPCVTPDGDAVMGIEALLRWKHPDRGLMHAGEFLPSAETARLMPYIAEWMCSQLFHDIAMWNAHDLPPLHIAMNISASQLDAPDLPKWLKRIADKDFLGHHRLALEIPEEIIPDLTHPRLIMLSKLTEMGVELHLDHFGRGLQSLTAMHHLPFSLLKLDMSLVQSMSKEVTSESVIQTAIRLAHHMGMKAAAVGVEAPWQAQTLKLHACDMMQGYLTIHPMTAHELIDWLQKPLI